MTEEQVQRIKKYYDSLFHEIYDEPKDEARNSEAIGIRKTLDILGLKVEGINKA